MSEPNSIAVVIPLYNKRPHVARAISSVLAQQTPPDEIIIVDDASTDGSAHEAARFEDSRIRLLRRDRPGPGGYAARNLGIKAARSEWIAFLDADDSWTPDAIAEARRLAGIADEGVSCLFTGYLRDYGDRTATTRPTEEGTWRRLNFAEFVDIWLATGQSPMWTSAVVARRSALIEAGLFPAGKCLRGGDKDTWLRLVRVGDALCSGAVTARYHRDSVNMVTKTTDTNHRPYLCNTLEALLPMSTTSEAQRIRRLINWEIYTHARHAWRSGIRIDRDIGRGFVIRSNPAIYLLLQAMASAPDWLLNASYRLRAVRAGMRPSVGRQP